MTYQDRCRQSTDACQLQLLLRSLYAFRTSRSGQGQGRLQQGVIPVYTPSSCPWLNTVAPPVESSTIAETWLAKVCQHETIVRGSLAGKHQ